jgi:L-cystine transport system permease protein
VNGVGEFFSWSRFVDDIPRLLPYLPVTLGIVAYAIILGVFLGMVIALLRIHGQWFFQPFLRLYISFMRGTPMLVQILIVFYGLPIVLQALGIEANRWDKIVFVYIAFALNEGAFLSEIFRSSILSVPTGQMEAALSVGLTRWQAYRRIVLPQAIRIALPSFGTDFIALFHGTSLAFLIGVVDIMGRAKTLGASTKHALEAYLFIALLFIVASALLRLLFHFLDRKLSYT